MTTGLDPVLEEPRPAPEPERYDQRKLPPAEWAKENLFNSPVSSVLTVLFGLLIAYTAFRAARFALFSARWDVIEVNLTNLMVGRFPRGQLARLWMAIYLLAAVGGLGLGASSLRPEAVGPRERLRRVAPVLVGVAAILSFTRTPLPLLLTLGAFAVVVAMRFVGRRAPAALTRRLKFIYVAGIIGAYLIIRSGGGVGFNGWGGFLLTLGVATGGIVLSFPLGVALGLGRRSTFPVIRTFCVGYIEIIRGVPLITLLFIGSVTIGLFLPPGSPRPQLVTRGLVVIVLFTAAYLAETVRGGLQSVPGGQVEAAKAIGLSPLKTTYLIVLPQALRNVIPTLVGQFIALLKDTTLLSIIGLIELLGVGQALLAQSDFRGQGLQGEIFAFAGFLYWVCCYSMSKASQRLERRLGVGER